MLTRLRIKNFKRFPDADIELGQSVVFIGQNNSGKTTALQALALWDVGLRKWNIEYKGKAVPIQRPGVTINRRDLVAIPVPQESVLLAYARHDQSDDLFSRAEAARREPIMRECIHEITAALQTLGRPGPWSDDVKASDDFLNPLFDRFFQKLGLPNLLRKTDYHVLADLVPADKIAPEVLLKLDAIAAVAQKGKPKE
jgi:hypothetical protein